MIAVIRKYVIYHDLISTSWSFPYYVNQHGLSRRQRFIQRQIILTLIAHGGADTWASEAKNGLFVVRFGLSRPKPVVKKYIHGYKGAIIP